MWPMRMMTMVTEHDGMINDIFRPPRLAVLVAIVILLLVQIAKEPHRFRLRGCLRFPAS